jgi:hypothetical protein
MKILSVQRIESAIQIIFYIFCFSSYIQLEESYICIPETYSYIYMFNKVPYNPNPSLSTRTAEHNTMSCITTNNPMLHLMLDSVHHLVQFRNVSRFWLVNLQNWRDRREDKIKMDGVVWIWILLGV